MKPPCWPPPSPKIVFISMPFSMYIMPPASATTLSPGSSSISTNCISVPKISKSISSARPVLGAGGGGAGAAPAMPLNSSTDLGGNPPAHAFGEDVVLAGVLTGPELRLEIAFAEGPKL